MKNLIANTLFLFPVLLCTCSKPAQTQQLPAATHTGADIIACKVNGKVVVWSGAGGKLSQFGPGVYYEVYADSNTVISATSGITFGSKNYTALGTYKIDTTPYAQGAAYYAFHTDSAHGGSVTYTFYDHNILAGTFAFDAVDENDSVVHITEGRFDIENH